MRKTKTKQIDFDQSRKRYRDISELIFNLEVDNVISEVVDKFRQEFLPQGTKFTKLEEKIKWEVKFFTDKDKSERYRRRLYEIAAKYGFLDEEDKKSKSQMKIKSLETHLLTDETISYRNDKSDEDEKNKYHLNQAWQTIPRVRNIIQKRAQGRSFRQIADHYNKILKRLKIPERITEENLRKDISKAYKKNGEENIKLLTGKA